jgi:hypothetical protein
MCGPPSPANTALIYAGIDSIRCQWMQLQCAACSFDLKELQREDEGGRQRGRRHLGHEAGMPSSERHFEDLLGPSCSRRGRQHPVLSGSMQACATHPLLQLLQGSDVCYATMHAELRCTLGMLFSAVCHCVLCLVLWCAVHLCGRAATTFSCHCVPEQHTTCRDTRPDCGVHRPLLVQLDHTRDGRIVKA